MTPADLNLRPLGRESSVVAEVGYVPLTAAGLLAEPNFPADADGFLAVRVREPGRPIYVYAAPAWLYALIRNPRTSAGRIFARHLARRRPSLKIH